MKVLKNNYIGEPLVNKIANIVEPYPRKHICDNCGSELEYEESDMRMGMYGCMFIDCPLCGYDNMLDDNENNIELTSNNIEFPTHFYHTSKETGAVDICNTEHIRERLNKAIDYFRKNKDEYFWTSQSGNLYICVQRWAGDEVYEITVSNDLYSVEIPFQEEDKDVQ